jgi:hypothetical protein
VRSKAIERKVDYVNYQNTQFPTGSFPFQLKPFSVCTVSSDSFHQAKVAKITAEEISIVRKTESGSFRVSNSRVLDSIDEFSSDMPSLPYAHKPEDKLWL